jgi:hypothetical protein
MEDISNLLLQLDLKTIEYLLLSLIHTHILIHTTTQVMFQELLFILLKWCISNLSIIISLQRRWMLGNMKCRGKWIEKIEWKGEDLLDHFLDGTQEILQSQSEIILFKKEQQ